MFLADRQRHLLRVRARGRRGAGAERTWIDPLKFEDPACTVCGNRPEKRTTTHWYLDLPRLRDDGIGDWIRGHRWKSNVANFIANLLEDVPERAITRDMSWGVPLPEVLGDKADGKVLYVWFDAPIGYISFTKELLESRGEGPQAWERWWKSEDTRLVHFIGKDNIPFHCLVFPSMLHGTGAGYVLLPRFRERVHNLEGGKFSSGGNVHIKTFQQRDSTRPASTSRRPCRRPATRTSRWSSSSRSRTPPSPARSGTWRHGS